MTRGRSSKPGSDLPVSHPFYFVIKCPESCKYCGQVAPFAPSIKLAEHKEKF
jgi:hypothetical protein